MFLVGVLFFGLALGLGTLVEYIGHRLMHAGLLFPRRHQEHHRQKGAGGWLWEFRNYALLTAPLLWPGFLHSVAAGVGFLLGGLLYAVAAAYSHQLQHEHPERVFWMRRPVHYLHHRHDQGQHNYGVVVDVWDRLLGTYKPYDWQRPADYRFSLAGLVDIRWF
jgi:sterol desaturase/sphingolipid hydroxylase (fatty acid hydroxylase superfamily)